MNCWIQPELDREEGEEEEEGAVTLCRQDLLKKLKEAKEESKTTQGGNFTCRHLCCPLYHAQMSKSTGEEGKTYLLCPNKCNLPYKPNNEKVKVCTVRTNDGKFNLHFSGPFIWNNLDEDLKVYLCIHLSKLNRFCPGLSKYRN